jgi:hypothetical protein
VRERAGSYVRDTLCRSASSTFFITQADESARPGRRARSIMDDEMEPDSERGRIRREIILKALEKDYLKMEIDDLELGLEKLKVQVEDLEGQLRVYSINEENMKETTNEIKTNRNFAMYEYSKGLLESVTLRDKYTRQKSYLSQISSQVSREINDIKAKLQADFREEERLREILEEQREALGGIEEERARINSVKMTPGRLIKVLALFHSLEHYYRAQRKARQKGVISSSFTKLERINLKELYREKAQLLEEQQLQDRCQLWVMVEQYEKNHKYSFRALSDRIIEHYVYILAASKGIEETYERETREKVQKTHELHQIENEIDCFSSQRRGKSSLLLEARERELELARKEASSSEARLAEVL